MPFLQSPQAENKIYDRLADSWWANDGVLHLLKTMVNPWRVPFFRELIINHFGRDLSSTHVLDVGCGGGLLAEEFSQIGCQVSGIDLSEKSIAVAWDHAQSSGHRIKYLVGNGTDLPFTDSSFEIVSCCDVLEHIPDWGQAIKEAARVLKPGGLFLFDTINRTIFSYIALIIGAQTLPLTRIFPKNTHTWHMFITPTELKQSLESHGLTPKGITGGEIKASPFSLLVELSKRRLGMITYKELGEKFSLVRSQNLAANYMGWAIKK